MALSYATSDDLRNYERPCREIEKLQYEYSEDYDTRDVSEEIETKWFQIRLYFPETTFKYIEQVSILRSSLWHTRPT